MNRLTAFIQKSHRGCLWDDVELPPVNLQKLTSIFQGYDNRNGSKFSIQFELKAYKRKNRKSQIVKEWERNQMLRIEKQLKGSIKKKSQEDFIDFKERQNEFREDQIKQNQKKNEEDKINNENQLQEHVKSNQKNFKPKTLLQIKKMKKNVFNLIRKKIMFADNKRGKEAYQKTNAKSQASESSALINSNKEESIGQQ